jgi:hypothetical protein
MAPAMAVNAADGSMEPQPAYVYDLTPEGLASYVANFYFDPNDAVTGMEPVDIFMALDASGAPVFGIQFMHTADAPNEYMVRSWAAIAGDEVHSEWVSIVKGPQNL